MFAYTVRRKQVNCGTLGETTHSLQLKSTVINKNEKIKSLNLYISFVLFWDSIEIKTNLIELLVQSVKKKNLVKTVKNLVVVNLECNNNKKYSAEEIKWLTKMYNLFLKCLMKQEQFIFVYNTYISLKLCNNRLKQKHTFIFLSIRNVWCGEHATLKYISILLHAS